jgi:DUF971 family protein
MGKIFMTSIQNSPTAIDVSSERLHIKWSDNHVSDFPARYLRAACQCAKCVSEITGAPLLDSSKIPAGLTILTAQPMGNYAVNIKFSDHHDTGIYTYENLREICPCVECQKRQ